jgi:hypothetical protein
MLRSKRQGVELSMNAIIVMALALIVLAVMAFLLLKNAGKFGEATKCETQGGDCVELTKSCSDAKPVLSTVYSCPTKEKPKCCVDGGLGQK